MAGTKGTYRKAEQLRADILQATVELLTESAAADLTVRQIAEQAGVAHSEIFRLYGTKANLVREVVIGELLAWARAAATESDPVDSFMAGFRFILVNPIVMGVLAPGHVADPELGDQTSQDSFPVIDAHVEVCCAAGMDRSEALPMSGSAVAMLSGLAVARPFYMAAWRLESDDTKAFVEGAEVQVRALVDSAMERSKP